MPTDIHSFLAKLNSMNWLEKRHEREVAIAAGLSPLWMELANALCKAVDSFNALYRMPHRQGSVFCGAATDQVNISCQLPTGNKRELEKIEHATVTVVLSRASHEVTYSSQHSKVPLRGSIKFDRTEDGSIVLVFKDKDDKDQVLDPDTASKMILESFLFALP